MTKKLSVFLCSILLITSCISNIFSQEKWSRDPRITAIYASGTYTQLPQVKTDFEPAIQQTRIYNTQNGLLLVPPNFRPHASAGNTQSECPLTRNKLLPNILFRSANTVWPPNGYRAQLRGTAPSGVAEPPPARPKLPRTEMAQRYPVSCSALLGRTLVRARDLHLPLERGKKRLENAPSHELPESRALRLRGGEILSARCQ